MNTPQRSGTPSGDFRSRMDTLKRSISATPSVQSRGNGEKSSVAPAMSVSIAQEHRLARLVEVITALEKQLASESAARIGTTQALLNTFEARLQEACQRMEHHYQERVVTMNIAVDRMTDRIAELEQEVAAERDKNARLTRELMGHNTSDIDEIKERLAKEHDMRESAIKSLVAKVSNELDSLHERLDAEHILREKTCRELHQRVSTAAVARRNDDARLVGVLRGEIAKLATALDTERNEREMGEEGLAATLEAIVQSL